MIPEKTNQAMQAILNINLTELPRCPKCDKGQLLPCTDFTQNGEFYLKGWVCSNCDHNIFFSTGKLVRLLVTEQKG